MARKVFFSFHYKPDCVRASQVRNIGSIEGNKSANDNDWEAITKGGDKAIQSWIDSQLMGRTCTVVLIGSNTADRKWIDYEIKKSWDSKKGLLGIHIHNLKNFNGDQSSKGKNPFKYFKLKDKSLANVVQVYDPPFADSKKVYDYIKKNLADWIEEAIEIRNNN